MCSLFEGNQRIANLGFHLPFGHGLGFFNFLFTHGKLIDYKPYVLLKIPFCTIILAFQTSSPAFLVDFKYLIKVFFFLW